MRTSRPPAFDGPSRAATEAALPGFLPTRRWFGGKARRIRQVTVVDAVPLKVGRHFVFLTLVRVGYADGTPEIYTLLLGSARGDEARRLRAEAPGGVIAGVALSDGEGLVYDALDARRPPAALLRAIVGRRVLEGRRGTLVGVPGRAFRRLRPTDPLHPRPIGAEQSNSSVVFGGQLILKIFRRVEAGSSPELEIGQFLTERAKFAQVPATLGHLEYRPRRGGPIILGVLQACVANRGDAWTYTLAALERFYRRLLAAPHARRASPRAGGSLLDRASVPIPHRARTLVGSYLDDARLLGRRTGELHLALARGVDNPAVAPVALTASYRRALGRSMRTLAARNLSLLQRRLSALSGDAQASATDLLDRRGELLDRCRAVETRPVVALRTRVHGDYHLGQVLHASDDFVIIDFEGEPAMPLSARRARHSPLKDVAGMVRSFHYAAHHALHRLETRRALPPETRAALVSRANEWYEWVSAAFLAQYLATVEDAAFLPTARGDVEALLTAYLLEKAVYELGYELNNRPEWVHLPLAGIQELLAAGR